MERQLRVLPEGIFIKELSRGREIQERNSLEIKLPNCNFHEYAV